MSVEMREVAPNMHAVGKHAEREKGGERKKHAKTREQARPFEDVHQGKVQLKTVVLETLVHHLLRL